MEKLKFFQPWAWIETQSWRFSSFLIFIEPSWPPEKKYLDPVVMNVDSKSWASIYSRGAWTGVFPSGWNLAIGSYGCLYFFKNLSLPVVNISPEGRTLNSFWSRSVRHANISHWSYKLVFLFFKLTAGGPLIIKIPNPIPINRC